MNGGHGAALDLRLDRAGPSSRAYDQDQADRSMYVERLAATVAAAIHDPDHTTGTTVYVGVPR
jgi:hypothetical protein